MSLVCFQVSKICTFFGKFTVELILKSFSGRNNFIEAPDFGFSNSLPDNLEESIELTAFLVGFWVNMHSKMLKNCKIQFFSLFGWFLLKFCPQNLLQYEDVSIKCPKQFSCYIEFIRRRACEEKTQVWISCLQLVSRIWKSGCYFGKLISWQNWFPKASCFQILW